MAKVDQFFKDEVANFSKKDLEKLVIKAASQNKSFHDYILLNYISSVNGEEILYEEAKKDIQEILNKGHKGLVPQLILAAILTNCNKRIVEFSKICKNKELELELILFLLEIPFQENKNFFGTIFYQFNQQVNNLVKKSITIITTKIHPDKKLDYLPKVNLFLKKLHEYSNHLDHVYALPNEIE